MSLLFVAKQRWITRGSHCQDQIATRELFSIPARVVVIITVQSLKEHCLLFYHLCSNICYGPMRGRIKNFLRGERGKGLLYLGVVEVMRNAPKMWQFDNWNLIVNYCTRHTNNTKK